jgi:HK97 family phage major capsid protein
MSKLVELREQFEKKAKEQADLLAKGEALTQEDVLKAEALNGDLDKIQGDIEVFAKAGKLADAAKAREARLSQPAYQLPHPDGSKTFVAWQPAGETHIEDNRKGGVDIEQVGEGLIGAKAWQAIRQPDYRESFMSYLKAGWGGLSNVQQKTLQEGSDTAGGFLVPEDLMNAIVMKKPTPTRILNYVQTFTTSRDALTIPKVNWSTDDLYTTGIKVTWTGEVPASSTTSRVTDPVFGSVRIPVFTAMLSMPVTNDMLEDSAVALLPWVESRFAETIELTKDDRFLNGTGVGQPAGILLNPGGTNQPATVVSGNASALLADGIVALGYSLPEQYDDEARFVMNKTNTAKAVAQLKDTSNRYIWGMGYQDSGIVPPLRNRELLGYPVNFSGFMPNVGANNFPIIFGDFRGYYAVNRIGLSIQVLRELYAETNQVLLLGRIRFGGLVAEDWRLKVQKVST